VIEGQLEITIGEEQYRAGPGIAKESERKTLGRCSFAARTPGIVERFSFP
jgi:hypothetical protein